MPLSPGARLGPYEIQAPLGAGGMGEAYQATDTRLDRTVAIKVLPSELAGDPERRERFEREAKTISSLNHPHICTLHDVGHQDGVDFLVMEHLEGETLADRLTKGALTLDQAPRYGIETADALDKAHRQGIVHRDLKPGNIMLTKAGAKLLDFGLAKLQPREEHGNLSQLSAQATLDQPLTEQGTILGTFQYMAPEQIEGGEADPRTNIFAFGAVLYQMLTGQKAFTGTTQASLIGAILRDDARPPSDIQPLTPRSLDRFISKCLGKNPDDRWQSARDLVTELHWIQSTSSDAEVATVLPESRRGSVNQALGWAVALLATLGLVMMALWTGTADEPAATTRLSITLPGQRLFESPVNPLALSPDGRLLVYSAQDPAAVSRQLYLRRLDHFDTEAIPGTRGGVSPFFSPDGETIGFVDVTGQSTLKTFSLLGDTVSAGATLRASAADPRGVSWGDDGTLILGTAASGLWVVSQHGGDPEPLTTVEAEESHRDPHRLPDGRHVLFSTTRAGFNAPSDGRGSVALLSLDTREWRRLFRGAMPHYLPSGHIVYTEDNALLAVPFDLDTLSVSGSPTTLLRDVFRSGPSNALYPIFSISNNGVLAYAGGGGGSSETTLVWVDRDGTETQVGNVETNYHTLRLSPDGRFVAAHDLAGAIWAIDLARSTRTLIVRGTDVRGPALWDARQPAIVFGMDGNLYQRAADGTGEPSTLLARRGQPLSMLQDGRLLLFGETHPERGRDISVLDSEGNVEPLFVTEAMENAAVFSPDGRWVAYQTDTSGQAEIYVEPFPGSGPRTLVSTDGGTGPVWSPRGDELFYRQNRALMAVPVKTDGGFEAGRPVLLFDGPYQYDATGHASYDVSGMPKDF